MLFTSIEASTTPFVVLGVYASPSWLSLEISRPYGYVGNLHQKLDFLMFYWHVCLSMCADVVVVMYLHMRKTMSCLMPSYLHHTI